MTDLSARPNRVHDCMSCAAPQEPHILSRRDILAGGASAAVLLGLVQRAFAQAKPHRIDVHHHISAPTWLAAVKGMQKDNPPMNGWTIQKSIEDMDKGGVAIAITSPTTPQIIGLDKDRAVRVCRESNEYAKKLETQYPGRFGTFAMLPFPHMDECLAEIAYAFDTLKVDGVGCMTNYGDKWLGYNDFTPVWDELNRRGATVYTHPTSANCCVNLVNGIPDVYIEYGTDTTRSIFSVIFSGTAGKYRNIKWIWSHGGGVLTSVAERLLIQIVSRPPYLGKFSREDVQAELNRFYYDTAQVSNSVTLSALAQLVPASQIVYGTDFPYRTAQEHTAAVAALFKGKDLNEVERENALRLLPRLRAA
jgi:6-methylsalicylate decarboxylase